MSASLSLCLINAIVDNYKYIQYNELHLIKQQVMLFIGMLGSFVRIVIMLEFKS